MSYNSGDDQSEDGELRQSPENARQKSEIMDFSLSEEDGDNLDSLDIKPPQARISSRSKRRLGHDERSHHKRSEKHREDRHSHREKHHREKQSRSNKERDHHYQREKERYYREKQTYEQQGYNDVQYLYRERKEESGSRSRHPDQRKHDDKKVKEEKHRRYENERRERGDRTLQDLRERLLSKRTNKPDDDNQQQYHKEKSERGKYKETIDSVLEGESGMYVKEIINISTSDERRHKRDGEKLTDDEKVQQELRKEKLLEAEREMARMKEQSRAERERRHLEKAAKRRHYQQQQQQQQQDEDFYNKRQKIDESQIVTVSDNTDDNDDDDDDDEDNDDYDRISNDDGNELDNRSDDSALTSSDSSRRSDRSDHSSDSRERSVSSDRKSRSRSGSSERSTNSTSPKSNGMENSNEKDNDEKLKKDENKSKLDDDLPPYYPAIQGCRSVEEFQCLNRIEEGTYGVVYRAKDKRTEDIVALKRLKMEKEKEGFPITSLREINTLLKGQHPNIVTVREIVVGSNMDKIFIVMDYVEHDLKSLMETMRHKKQNFTPGEVKCLLKQLLLAVAHLHDNWILHRDLKTSNLLLSHKGILKVGDFGLAREYGSPLKPYTPIVVTLWYRAPELLLCTKEYSTPIDMWSVGCIFAELLLMNAIFPGKSEVDQLNRIFKDLGTPNERIWTGFNELPAVKKMKFTEYPISNLRNKFHMLTDLGLNLLTKFLTYDPVQRVTAEEALKHTYFQEAPLPIDPAMFPTWPAKSELGQKRALAASPKPPSGGGEYKKLGGDVDDDGYGFRIGMGIDHKRLGGGFSLKF